MLKKFVFPLFIIVSLIQLYVPYSMIRGKEAIVREGIQYKFKAAPVDPNDPFRGKYLDVNFSPDMFSISDEKDWAWGQQVYIIPGEDKEGYFEIADVLRATPSHSNYFTAEVQSVYDDKIWIRFPFDRFYMTESKALAAEEYYREALRDSSTVAYALISIKDGDAVFTDLKVNETSIKDLVE